MGTKGREHDRQEQGGGQAPMCVPTPSVHAKCPLYTLTPSTKYRPTEWMEKGGPSLGGRNDGLSRPTPHVVRPDGLSP